MVILVFIDINKTHLALDTNSTKL